MIYTIHFNQKDPNDKKWLSLLRDLDCKYAFTGKEFKSIKNAKKYANQITQVTGVKKLMIIEDYDISEDFENPDYDPVIHYLGDSNE